MPTGKRLTLEEANSRISKFHGDLVLIDWSTYKNTMKKCTFIHKVYGAWEAYPTNILRGATHPQAYLDSKSLPIETVKERLFDVHKGLVSIVENTYKSVSKKATFIHIEDGSWETKVEIVLDGNGHPNNRKFTEKEIKEKLDKIHKGEIELIWSSFVNTQVKAKFVHIEHGEFWAIPNNMFRRGDGCPKDRQARRIETNKFKYGVGSPMQNIDIALKAAKSQTRGTVKFHWKTNKELSCQASWEPKVVEYLNTNKINYLWQPQVFKMPNGRTYRPDLYLEDEDKWVEIKGYFRKDALEKWNWFQSVHPNSELWDKAKLKSLGIL